MDPMQVQNQQPIGAVQQPQAPVQYVAQNIPQQVQMQQPVQQDSVFDKILKGIVDFIAKLAAPTPGAVQQPQAQVQQPVQQMGQPMIQQPVQQMGQPIVQQPVQQVEQPIIQNTPQQTIPGADFFNKIGNTLDAIGNQAEKIVQTGTSNVIASTQNYVSEQPVASVDTQQFLAQNYQPNTQQQVSPAAQQPQQSEIQQPEQQPNNPSQPSVTPQI